MSVFNVPVVIGVDEEAIAREIKENVESQVVAKILEDVKHQMYTSYDYYCKDYRDPEPLRNMIKGQIHDILEQNQALIVKEASVILADKLFRSKAVKEKAKLIADTVLEEEK